MGRLFAHLLLCAGLLPFMVAGIVAAAVLALQLTGIEFHEKSWVAVGVFLMLVPVGILMGGMIFYALLLSILRLASREHWLDAWATAATPPPAPKGWTAPLIWVRKIVHRLIPR